MHLPEDDPTTFDWIINWLYRDQLPKCPGEGMEVGSVIKLEKSLIDIFLFAEKYCIEVLGNRVMDILQDFHLGKRTIPYLEHIKYVYSNTCEQSKLRLYLAATTCYCFTFPKEGIQIESCRSYSKLGREVPEYGADFMEIQYERGFMVKDKPRVDPRKCSGDQAIGPCYFHTHSDGEVRHSGAYLFFLYTCLGDYYFEFVVLTCRIDVSSKRRKVIQDLRENICLGRWSDDGAAADHALGDGCTLA
jgi:hypothetical protein